MSNYLLKQFVKGIALRGEATDIDENVEGSLFHNKIHAKIKAYIEGAVREVITESQIQTLTNKTIVAADNFIQVASTNTNLSSVELNLALTELQNDIDSKGAAIESHIADADPHPQYETSVESQAKVDAHANRVDNPHSVTKSQLGLSNVDNTSDADKPISNATQVSLNSKANLIHTQTASTITDFSEAVDDRVSSLIVAGSNISAVYNDTANTLTISSTVPVITDHTALSNIGTNTHDQIDSHIASTLNPHGVTKSQVGLSNVDNTSDLNKPISTATQTALDLKIDESREGQALGIATLDATGKVPASQLPSYVDDVVEVASFSALPVTGETSKIYITLDNNKTYRWSGSVYVEVSASSDPVWGAITGTLSNQSDLQTALDGKANTTHTHVSTDITDFNESVDDRVNSLIVAGTNISATYDDIANTLTIASTVSVITDHTALSNIGTNSHADIDSHISSTSNPHSVTKSQVGLSNVDNTSDLNKPISTATQNALNSKYDSSNPSNYVDASGAAAAAPVQSVAGKVGIVLLTKSDVGLSNVDNTSDLNKPVSTATQTALNGKADLSHTHVASDITDLSEAIDDRISSTIVAGSNVTVTYDDLANTLTIAAVGGGTGGASTLDELTDVSVPSPSNGQALVYNSTSSQWEAQTLSSGGGATELNSLNDVTLSGTLDNQILRYDLASTQWKNETLLKDDIGLSNVDNTSDLNKPISTATQTALNLKYDSSNPSNYVDSSGAAAAAPVQSVAGKVGIVTITKSDVGLSNVDNTSDLSKPISTATQTALDGKANTSHTHVSTDITDFSESVDDRVSSLLVAGSNITLTYNDVANTLVIDSAGAPASTSAERLITNVYNGSGATIPKMSVVYVNGAQGDQAKIVLAQANTEATSSKTYGVVVADIADTASGTVVEQGRLDNLNTDIAEWTEGDVLWLSPTIAGGITNVKPSAPNHAVFVGYLVRKHQSVGAIQVSIQNGYELQELHNVAISSIADNQVLKYDAPNSLWRNETLVKADVGLSDVDNTSDLDKPISTATQTALDGKANTSHTHVAADITDFNSAVDARIPSIPSTIVSSVNGDTGPDIILDSDDIEEGASNLYFTNERVDDRVSGLLVAGSGIALSYNDSANTLTVTATGVVAGASKYVRGFSVSGFITSSAAAAMPLIITSNATINSIKAYCKTTGSGVNIDILKNGTSIFTGGYTLNMTSSSVVTATSSNYSSSLLTDDILELSVTMAEAGVSKDLVVSIELIS